MAMTGFWRPCDEHEGLGDQLIVTANSGYEWHWDRNIWVAALAAPVARKRFKA